jgi:hypothetical protein
MRVGTVGTIGTTATAMVSYEESPATVATSSGSSSGSNGSPSMSPLTEQFVIDIVRSNQEFQLQMMKQYTEMVSKVAEGCCRQATVVHNDHRQQHNHFQLQVFLNDWCQGAMNMSEFVESIPYNPDALEKAGEMGFVQCITDLVVNSLNKLDVCERPLHCTDAKRETIHIKENDKWEKDSLTHTRLKKALATVAHLNLRQLEQWKQLHPDYNNPDSDAQECLFRILRNAILSNGRPLDELTWNEVVSNVARQTTVDKRQFIRGESSGGGGEELML